MRSNVYKDAPRLCVPKTLVKSYSVEVRTAGGWKTLADESQNLRRLAVIPVDEPVTAVRVQLREDWGARPTLHLFSFDVG